MFSREFTYKGYDGTIHKETRWFNLSDAELYEMQLGTVGGVDGMMRRMLREDKPDVVIDMFKKLILKAVGERSADGRRFTKKEHPGMPWGEVAEDFYETPAYSELFTELVSNGDKFVEFLMKAIPDETAERLRKAKAVEDEAEKENIVEINTYQKPDESGEPDAP